MLEIIEVEGRKDEGAERFSEATHMLKVSETHSERLIPTLESLELDGEVIVVGGTDVVFPGMEAKTLFNEVIPTLEEALETEFYLDEDVLRRAPKPSGDDRVVLSLPYGYQAAEVTIVFPDGDFRSFDDICYRVQKMKPSEEPGDVSSWIPVGSEKEFANTMDAAQFAVSNGGAKGASSFLYGSTLERMAKRWPDRFEMRDGTDHRTNRPKKTLVCLIPDPEDQPVHPDQAEKTDIPEAGGKVFVVRVHFGRGHGYRYSAVDVLIPVKATDPDDIFYRVQRMVLKSGEWAEDGEAKILDDEEGAVRFAYNVPKDHDELPQSLYGTVGFLNAVSRNLMRVLVSESGKGGRQRRRATLAFEEKPHPGETKAAREFMAEQDNGGLTEEVDELANGTEGRQ